MIIHKRLKAIAKGMVPVIQVDETTIGNGKPCPLTRQLIKKLAEHTTKDLI